MKNLNLNIVLLIILGFLFSCNSEKTEVSNLQAVVKPYPHVINIKEGYDNHAQIKLSSIADSIKYIVLSKEKDVIISAFPFLQMTDSDIYINFRGLIYRFALSGKFLNTIGKIGRGPKEYMSGSPFAISPYSNTVFVKRNYTDDYISYKSSGEFIGKISLKKSDNVWEFRCLSDSIFVYTFNYIFMREKSLDDIILCGLFNKKGDKIQVIEHPAKKTSLDVDNSRLGIPPPGFTFYNNEVVLSYLDTVYKISANSISAGFIFNWGDIPHRQSFEELYYIQTEPSKKVTKWGQFLETHGKAYFILEDPNEHYLFEYDKITGTTKSMLSGPAQNLSLDNDLDIGFINDLDGGVNYYPKWTNNSGDIWIDWDDAFNFKKVHNKDFLSISNAAYPDRKKDLTEFLNYLNEDDNPVLKIVYLKKSNNKHF
jgi:hypothetical protein